MIMDNRFLVARRRYDPDATRYINAVQLADGQALEPEVAMAVDAFVRGCKADGTWSAIQASCIMCGARTLSGALVPLKTPYGPELVSIDALPTPTIVNFGGTAGYYDAPTRTMQNPTVAAYVNRPIFSFDFGLTIGKRYRIIGVISGDIADLTAGERISPGIAVNVSTGVIDTWFTATSSTIKFNFNSNFAPSSVRIESLSIREDSFTPTPYNFASGDYSRTTGLKGDGATKYLDSNRAADADGLNDFHLCVYASEATTAAAYAGAESGSATGATHIGYSSGNLFVRNRSSTADTVSGAGPQTGTIAINRQSSAEYNYLFGTLSGAFSRTSQSASTLNHYIFRRNGDTGSTDARLAFYSVGSAVDLAALDTRVTTLVAAIAAAI